MPEVDYGEGVAPVPNEVDDVDTPRNSPEFSPNVGFVLLFPENAVWADSCLLFMFHQLF